MSTSKHTPGPWSTSGNYTAGHGVSVWSQDEHVADAKGFMGVEQIAANARLIAAAPDMLEALHKLDGHLSILMGNIHGSEKVDHRWEGMEDVVRGWRADIAAAIAKAEGRS